MIPGGKKKFESEKFSYFAPKKKDKWGFLHSAYSHFVMLV